MSKQSPSLNPAPVAVRSASDASAFEVGNFRHIRVHLKRPDGSQIQLKVENEDQLQRLMDLTAGEFGDKSIVVEGKS